MRVGVPAAAAALVEVERKRNSDFALKGRRQGGLTGAHRLRGARDKGGTRRGGAFVNNKGYLPFIVSGLMTTRLPQPLRDGYRSIG